jgi:UDP-N-acetylglucosamine 4,6-dehydratase
MKDKISSCLITGGTGSFGQALTKKLLEDKSWKRIVIFSRDELKQYEMRERFKNNKKLRFFIGDVRDKKRLIYAFNNIDVVFHAAALKQVPAAEYNPTECIKTNIYGAENVIDAAISCHVKKIIALSTDKAAAPINLYGASKLVSDKLFSSANNLTGSSKIIFSIVRYGNVLNSRGSVVPLFKKYIKEKKILPITDLDMTRFFITLDDGVNFVLKCLKRMRGGEIFVPKIPSFKITDLAYAMDDKSKFNTTGIRPGEKIHEQLFTISDNPNIIEFKDFFIIKPTLNIRGINYQKTKIGEIGKKINKKIEYNSNNKNKISIDGIKKILKKIKII